MPNPEAPQPRLKDEPMTVPRHLSIPQDKLVDVPSPPQMPRPVPRDDQGMGILRETLAHFAGAMTEVVAQMARRQKEKK